MGRIYETYVKRALDVALSGCALAVLSPVMGVTALLVRQKLGSPVIFHQDRPGKDEQIFRLYKFRTMTDARGADGELLPDAQRLTPFGRRLRSTSLDELPELWNILRGDMSIVATAPAAGQIPAILHRRGAPPPCRAPRSDRACAGQRPQRPALGRPLCV